MSAASDAGGSWPVKVGGGQLCRHARPGQPFRDPLLREWSSAQQRRCRPLLGYVSPAYSRIV
jgi:hypothetical protein